MDVLTRFFDFGGDLQLELFKAACSQLEPMYLFIEEEEPWHQLLIKYLLPILEWRLALFSEDSMPAFEIHGEQSLEVEQESSGKLPEVALLNVFPMIVDTRDYELFLRQYEKFQNLYPFVFLCRPTYHSFVKIPSDEVDGFVAHIRLALGVPSLRFETIALDALRYSFKEIERQAFLLKTQVARSMLPESFRAGQESQEHLSAKLLAYHTLLEVYEESKIVLGRRLFPGDPALLGNTARDNLELERSLASKRAEPSIPDRLEQFADFRPADLLVPGEVWVEVEDLRTIAFGDQDPFAALQRKVLAKLAWIGTCNEFWLVLPNSLVAFFPEVFGSLVPHLHAALQRTPAKTVLRMFCLDYALVRLHEIDLPRDLGQVDRTVRPDVGV